jgi:predicted outer membrane repeat protein
VGGGAYNANNVNAVLALVRSTVSSNTASFGGGVQNEGTLISDTSTFALNQAGTDGGAISAPFNSAVTLIHTTIAANTASGSGGGVIGDAFTAHYSIVSLNNAPTGPNQSGANFLSDQTIVNGNPLLGSLANNGGPTKTMALQAGSPGIDSSDSTSTRDQRNYLRFNSPDLGAVEFAGTIPNTLANISTRAFVQTGDNIMIGGFIISGTGTQRVMIRAIGPSLAQFGITNPLQNPTLELHDASGVIAINDNWGDATNHQEITDSGLAPGNSQESAILMNLNPGNYTALVKGVNNGTGVALIEGYALDRPTTAKFGNISTRAFVQTGDNIMIGGFIVNGPDLETVIVRAIGPSLSGFGIVNAMADPTLEIHDGNGTAIAINDNWKDSQQGQIQATGLAPSQDAESAIVQTLAPGNYTAFVKGKNDTTGVALVEVYGLN